MSAPILWIAIPILFTGVGWFLRRWPRVMQAVLAGASFLLALLAWQLRIGTTTNVGPWIVKIEPTLEILGRNFTLLDSERGLLVFVFAFMGIWLSGMRIAGARPVTALAALGMAALLIAARSVEPFLFSALLVEVAVLFSIPALIEPGKPVPQGVLRYLIFQTLALPFILLAGWAATEVEFDPNNQQLLLLAASSLSLGLALWLAVFPFYTWVPLLFSQVNPFLAALVLTLLPVLALFLLLDFLNTFTWLQNLPQLADILRLVGIVMAASAGIWAAFERNIYRLMGYAVVLESGFSLLALSLDAQSAVAIGFKSGVGVELFAFSVLPRVAAVGLGALALAILRRAEGEGKVKGLVGLLRCYPFVATAWILSILSIGGMPLFAGFPVRQAIYESLAAQSLATGSFMVVWPYLASIGLLVGGLRSMLAFVGGDLPQIDQSGARENRPVGWAIGETRGQITLLVCGIVILILIGLFPGVFLPMMSSLLV